LNIRLTHLVAEAMRCNGIKHLVFSSSAAVYGNPSDYPLTEHSRVEPLSPYGSAKLASENILLGHARAYGFSAICLRYFNIYGHRQDPTSPYSGVISIFAQRSLRGEPAVIFGNGTQTRDFVHVSDVARANALAVLKVGMAPSVFNVCTGRSLSLNDLLGIIRVKIPSAPAPQYADARNGDILRSGGDPRIAAENLGFVATTSVESGLPTFLDSLSAGS
jgi:UDP-glucose 4-epimerase